MAKEAGADLVEVAPNADPPVCKIMDYGKFLYQQAKRDKAAKARRIDKGIDRARTCRRGFGIQRIDQRDQFHEVVGGRRRGGLH